MKKLTSAIAALSFVLCLRAPGAKASGAASANRRGTVIATGHAVKAITAGPALLHGYSDIGGGSIFLARAVTGTDADCSAALASHEGTARTPLVADRIARVVVGTGQIACLVTDTHRSFELLWHAFPATGAATASTPVTARRGR